MDCRAPLIPKLQGHSVESLHPDRPFQSRAEVLPDFCQPVLSKVAPGDAMTLCCCVLHAAQDSIYTHRLCSQLTSKWASSPKHRCKAQHCRCQDWELAKAKQDKALDSIEKGIGTLKGIGEAMGETLKQQDTVLDAVDDKV